ncbi:MAG: hypothetical protein VR64_18635 [Desulfatitalea sp. BRH_c12]|nr:MAG: hypothetical protein VR64_18635 [Desulfatitalea sp. BRH_c12]
MGLVALDQLQEGVILSEDVRDINGRLMLSKGQQITANHIRIFRIWGIPEIPVDAPQRSTPADHASQKNTEKLLKTEHTVKKIFQNIDTHHPGIAALFKAAVDHRYEKDLLVEFGPQEPLADNFKLDLSSGLKTQIAFSEIQLPEAPEIISDYNKVVEDPLSSSNDIADVVNRSPSLAALLLKVVNSAFYGFPSKIDSLARAVSIIGTKDINALVTSISIMRLFHEMPEDLIDVATFRKHSLACGLLSRILAAQRKLPHTERLFVSGLLHDIGRLVWYRYFPEQAKLLLYMAKRTGLSVYEIEKECLGISHVQIAGHLLKKWKLPLSLANSIVYHHRPSRSPDPCEAGIVHMADIAINALGLGHSGEHIIPRFEAATWDRIGVAPGILMSAIGQTIEQLDVMEALLTEL